MWFVPGPADGHEERKNHVETFYREHSNDRLFADASVASDNRRWGTQYDEFAQPVSFYTLDQTNRAYRVHKAVPGTGWSEIELLWWINGVKPMSVPAVSPTVLSVALDDVDVSHTVMTSMEGIWMISVHHKDDLIVIRGFGNTPSVVRLETIRLGSLNRTGRW
jgi:hypothetical protein